MRLRRKSQNNRSAEAARLRRAMGTLIAAPLAALALLAGCNTAGCLDNRNSIPLAGLYSSTTGQAIGLDSVAIGGVGAPRDTLLNRPYGTTSTVYLPLRSTATSTSFYIRYLAKALDYPELVDTITVDYRSVPHFMSEECGAMYIYEIEHYAYTRHLVDSVVFTDSTINNLDIERVRIYFRTGSPDGDRSDSTSTNP